MLKLFLVVILTFCRVGQAFELTKQQVRNLNKLFKSIYDKGVSAEWVYLTENSIILQGWHETYFYDAQTFRYIGMVALGSSDTFVHEAGLIIPHAGIINVIDAKSGQKVREIDLFSKFHPTHKEFPRDQARFEKVFVDANGKILVHLDIIKQIRKKPVWEHYYAKVDPISGSVQLFAANSEEALSIQNKRIPYRPWPSSKGRVASGSGQLTISDASGKALALFNDRQILKKLYIRGTSLKGNQWVGALALGDNFVIVSEFAMGLLTGSHPHGKLYAVHSADAIDGFAPESECGEVMGF